MNDYSEYLKTPGTLAYIEQEWQANPKIHDKQARIINDAIKKYKLKSALEIGCGTGELAKRLNSIEIINYVGIDDNKAAIDMARKKAVRCGFIQKNIRDLYLGQEGEQPAEDIVFSFAFLKHFSLDEWSIVFKKIASFGTYFIFDIPISDETKDDGIEFHHVWLTMEQVKEEIEKAGLKLIEIKEPKSIEPIFICKQK